MELNNREIAILIWAVGLFAFLIVKAKAWPAVLGIFRSFWKPVILLSIGFMALYVEASVWVLWRIGFWTTDNLKTTIIWFGTFAVGWIFDLKRWEADPNEDVRVTLKEVLSVTAVVTFVTEFYTFNLIGELLFVPVVSFVALMAAFAQGQAQSRMVANLFNGILAVIGLSLLGYAAYRLIGDLRGFATADTGREFAVPSLLSLLFIPFMYAFNVWNAYSGALRTMSFSIKDEKVRRYARQRSFFWFGLNVSLLHRWKALLFRTKIDSVEALQRTVGTMKAARIREREPPLVAASEGWSPQLARLFLVAQNLTPGPYNPSFGTKWSASSPFLELGTAILPDNIAYYIMGTEHAATRLRIILNVNNPDDTEGVEQSLAAFRKAGVTLLVAALGDEAEGVIDRLAQGPDDRSQSVHASVWFEESEPFPRGGYSLMLTVEHSAHKEPDGERFDL